MRGIHKLEHFDLDLGVLNNKDGIAPDALQRVQTVERKLDAIYRELDCLSARQRQLLNEAAIVEEKLIDVCKAAVVVA